MTLHDSRYLKWTLYSCNPQVAFCKHKKNSSLRILSFWVFMASFEQALFRSQSHFLPGTALLSPVASSNTSLPLSLTLRNEQPGAIAPLAWMALGHQDFRKTLPLIWGSEQRIRELGQNLLKDHKSKGADVKFKVWELVFDHTPISGAALTPSRGPADALAVRCPSQGSRCLISPFVLSGGCWLLAQTSAYANRQVEPSLKKAGVISIHHLSQRLVTASVNTIEQEMPPARGEASYSLSGGPSSQHFSLALAPVSHHTTEPSGVNYIWLTEESAHTNKRKQWTQKSIDDSPCQRDRLSSPFSFGRRPAAPGLNVSFGPQTITN